MQPMTRFRRKKENMKKRRRRRRTSGEDEMEEVKSTLSCSRSHQPVSGQRRLKVLWNLSRDDCGESATPGRDPIHAAGFTIMAADIPCLPQC